MQLYLALVIETGTGGGIGAHFGIGDSHMRRMLSINLQGSFVFESRIEHDIGIR